MNHISHNNIVFQHYYQLYRNYLLKICCMDEERAVLDQLTLNDFKKWSSIALMTHSQVGDNIWQLKTL